MTLAALEATLRLYLDLMEAETQIPTISMLAKTSDDLREKAEQLCKRYVKSRPFILPFTGSRGSWTGWRRLSPHTAVGHVGGCHILENTPATFIELKMRENDIPIIGRISKDRYLLDVRTIEEKISKLWHMSFRMFRQLKTNCIYKLHFITSLYATGCSACGPSLVASRD